MTTTTDDRTLAIRWAERLQRDGMTESAQLLLRLVKADEIVLVDEALRLHEKAQKEAENPRRPVVQVGFAHDMSDSWFWLVTPDGQEWTYLTFSSLAIECDAQGWAREWTGDQQYNPERKQQAA